jgi:hypothetical protein
VSDLDSSQKVFFKYFSYFSVNLTFFIFGAFHFSPQTPAKVAGIHTDSVMLGPLNISLEDFGVSTVNGFLPSELPVTCLSDPYYEVWEEIVTQLPHLLRQKTIRTHIDTLSTLSTSYLKSEREWQRAYVLLAFLTQGYIWGGAKPSEVCSSLSSTFSY